MRRRAAPVRPKLPDPIFDSILITTFISSVMREGKKALAENIVYGALEEMYSQLEKSASSKKANSMRESAESREKTLRYFEQALNNVRPVVEVKSRRVGGSTYQVPCAVPMNRRTSLAFRWLIEFAKERKAGKSMAERLAAEILDAYYNRGNAVKKRDNIARMASANAAYSHYNWVSHENPAEAWQGEEA